jgi:predicted nucleic acid-binding Zn ribbon protein
MTARACPVCGASLEGRSRDAVYCSARCRGWQSRYRRAERARAGPRECAVCGVPLDGHRAEAVYCSGKCRAEASRFTRILSGEEVDGCRSKAEYEARRLGVVWQPPQEAHIRHVNGSHKPAEAVPVPEGRSIGEGPCEARVRPFVEGHIREIEGHETAARRLYGAYARWAAEHDPEGAVSRHTFDTWFGRLAPIEARVRRSLGKRGRPEVVYVGVRLTRGGRMEGRDKSAPAPLTTAGGVTRKEGTLPCD